LPIVPNATAIRYARRIKLYLSVMLFVEFDDFSIHFVSFYDIIKSSSLVRDFLSLYRIL
jgi:hypothetical protein